MKKGCIYDCDYTSGGGCSYDEGQWLVTAYTPKTVVIEKITEGSFYSYYKIGDTLKLIKDNSSGRYKGNTVNWWDDDSFTVYPQQCGTPFLFTPLERW